MGGRGTAKLAPGSPRPDDTKTLIQQMNNDGWLWSRPGVPTDQTPLPTLFSLLSSLNSLASFARYPAGKNSGPINASDTTTNPTINTINPNAINGSIRFATGSPTRSIASSSSSER